MSRAALSLALALAFAPAADAQQVARVLNWSDYIGPGLLESFTRETGVTVIYDNYDSGEVVETRLLAGGSGYDVVVISSEYLKRLIAAGALAPLDKARLPALADMSAPLMARLARLDPGNSHAAPYLWGTTGLGYDFDLIAERMPDAPLDSWAMVFDPEIVSRFADCGVTVIDSPEEVLSSALYYLGRDPNSGDPADIDAAAEVIAAIAPYVRRFDSEQIYDLAEGAVCLVIGWATDVLQARDIATAGHRIGFSMPKEGAVIWYDSFVIPADAPNPDAAHRFIEFMLRPENLAASTNAVWAPNANTLSAPFVDEAVLNDPLVYPDAAARERLDPVLGHDAAVKRAFVEKWTEIKLGF